MTELRLADTDPAELPVDAVVVGVYRGDGETPLVLAPGAGPVEAAFEAAGFGGLAGTLVRLGATGAADEVTKLATFGALRAPVVAAVGLGDRPADGAAPGHETLRRAAGAAVRSLAGSGTVALALPAGDRPADGDPACGAGLALVEGALLGAYRFAGYRSRPEPGHREPVGEVVVRVPDAASAEPAAARGRVTAAAAARARDWVNTVPNELRPPDFAEQVADAGRAAGLDVEVLDEHALAREGFGGILAVGGGSAAPPRLVRLAYRPEDTPGTPGAVPKVALVGKGITFDTGGLAIKPAANMWEMKSDMAGAAAVAAATLAIAALRLPVAVTAYLPMAENMPSGSAYRPGDVVRMRNGTRVEILNPDAEGRVILGDAMAWACEEEPDYLVETSTLTGGQVVALGRRVAGVMGTPELCERIRAAGERAGEPMWPMPLPEEVRSSMDSDIADLLQVSAGMDRAGHMLQGGIFLSAFVTDGVPWAHIDIAGPSFRTGEPTGYLHRGGTGVPVRTLVELVSGLPGRG